MTGIHSRQRRRLHGGAAARKLDGWHQEAAWRQGLRQRFLPPVTPV